ncbi:MAG: PKD domain-containing protein [Flavobacteriales bacterium]|nr:PKD domain-containing protein [Flavobacteriales bacterium]
MKKLLFLSVAGALVMSSCNKEPEVSFDASKTSAIVGDEIKFTNNSEAKKVYNVAWNFGDGGSSNTFDATHIYSRPGTYTVTLSGTSKKGNKTSSDTKTITVTAAPRSDMDMSEMPDDVRTTWEALKGSWSLSSGKREFSSTCSTSTSNTRNVSGNGLKYTFTFNNDGTAHAIDHNGNVYNLNFDLISAKMAELWLSNVTATEAGSGSSVSISFSGVYNIEVTDSKVTFTRKEVDDTSDFLGNACKDTRNYSMTWSKK